MNIKKSQLNIIGDGSYLNTLKKFQKKKNTNIQYYGENSQEKK